MSLKNKVISARVNNVTCLVFRATGGSGGCEDRDVLTQGRREWAYAGQDDSQNAKSKREI